MATRCNIIMVVKGDTKQQILYKHYDSHPDNVETIINNFFTELKNNKTEIKTSKDFAKALLKHDLTIEKTDSVHEDIDYLYFCYKLDDEYALSSYPYPKK